MLIAERSILTEEKASGPRSRLILEPLELGFGHTLGSSLRRTLPSSIPGAAVMLIRTDDVPHEFRTIEGVEEDVAEIILNIKQIALSSENDELVVMHLRKASPGEILAGDIMSPAGVKIHSPDLRLATLNEGDKLETEPTVERGRGYASAAQNKDPRVEISRILADSTHSPVIKVICKVGATHIRRHIDSDRPAIDVETRPAIILCDTLASAGKTLVELFDLMRELNEEAEGIEVGSSTTDATLVADLALPIENLNLQLRSYNALRRHDILTVGEPVVHSEADLLDIHSFGTKSTGEIKESLAVFGMTLKDSVVPSFGGPKSVTIFSDDQSI